ncbi:hypothetical protein C2E21_0044 [Chlorella sorokiniana]|uniref:Uncharacterized protein n=1 Tax=Chlorella sorokiniana TaxID=3076 RepID=A0A2P6U509_CHLSO|nr:hypothetical protein C2E21_0044 [Chlorella sorokiniana]|eukprot:PRW61352.1 hypothetical protein C2E21_0044 [Chlorella sorokiniana]
MGGPVVRVGNRNQSPEHARHRPLIKAATVLGWLGLNLRAPDLDQAGRDAPGSWTARRQGHAQLWREGQSDGTLCQGSKAALQFLMETIFQINLGWVLQQLAAQQAECAADESALPGQRAAAAGLAALAGASWVELRRFPRGGYDLVLCTRTPSGIRRVGLALQTRVAKVNQHWKLEQKERPWFKQQRLGRGLAVLFNGYRLAAATEGGVTAALAAAQRRREAGELNEDELEAEDEGEDEQEAAAEAAAAAEELDLAADSSDEAEEAEALLGPSEVAATDEEGSDEADGSGDEQGEEEQPAADAGIPGQRYFSIWDLPERACTNIVPFAELLLRLADKVQVSAQEIGQQASLLVIPPEGVSLRSLTLNDGLRLSQAGGELRLGEAQSVMQAALTVLPQLAANGCGDGAGSSTASGSSSGSDNECLRIKAAEALSLLERARAALAPGAASPPLHDGLALLKQCKQAVLVCLLEAVKQRSWQGHEHEQPAAAGANEEAEEGQPVPAKRPRRAAAERAAGGITAGVRGTRERFEWEKHPEVLQRFEEAVDAHGGAFATMAKDVWKSMGSPVTPTALQVHSRLDLMRSKQRTAAADTAALPAREARPPAAAVASPAPAGGAAAAAAASAPLSLASMEGTVEPACSEGAEAATPPPAEHGTTLVAAVFQERVGHVATLKMGPNPMPLSALPQPQLAAIGLDARQRAILLRVMRARQGHSVKLIDRVGGDSRATLSVRKTMCVQGQAFLLIEDPAQLLDESVLGGMHVNESQVDAMEVGGTVAASSSNDQSPLHLLHAAALPYINLAGEGIRSGEGHDWQGSFVALADPEQQAGLAEALHAVERSGLLSITQLHNGIGSMRKPLAEAGARMEAAAYRAPLLGAGDPASQQQLQHALSAFEAGCQVLGAGPLPGMVGVSAVGGGAQARKELNNRWQHQVEALWPGTKPLFEAVQAAGVELTTVKNRFRRLPGDIDTAILAARKTLKPQAPRAL